MSKEAWMLLTLQVTDNLRDTNKQIVSNLSLVTEKLLDTENLQQDTEKFGQVLSSAGCKEPARNPPFTC